MWGKIEPRLQELAKRAGMRDMPSGVIAAVLVLAVVAVAWAAWRWWPSDAAAVGPESQPAATAVAVAQSEGKSSEEPPDSDTASGAPAVDTSLVVHVAGEVRHPGVYDVPAGARVIDAIESAGGLLGDAAGDSVNLARQVADGEQIVIPSRDEVASGAAPAASTAAPAGVSSASGVPADSGGGTAVNINSADAAALDQLPGVGPSTAQKIIADREASGPFASPEDLGRVSGIGPKRLEQLKDLVCVR